MLTVAVYSAEQTLIKSAVKKFNKKNTDFPENGMSVFFYVIILFTRSSACIRLFRYPDFFQYRLKVTLNFPFC